jgi:transmembrane sensor
MSIFDRHNDKLDDAYKYIAEHIDDDIEKLLNGQELPAGDKGAPDFDEAEVYHRISAKMRRNSRKTRMRMLRWACIAAAIIGISVFAFYSTHQESPTLIKEVYAQRGEKMVVQLADGSRVWLNSDTRLTYPDRFNGKQREVEIDGEAYFEVAKDASHPFIVKADNMMIRVTGTKFNVNAYSDENKITTTLDEGHILVGLNGEDSKLYNVEPQQSAVFDRRTLRCTISNNAYAEDESGWKENWLTFRNSSLTEVLTTLSRRYDVHFNVKSKRIKGYTYNLTCKASDVGDVLNIMETITPVKFKKTNENAYDVR